MSFKKTFVFKKGKLYFLDQQQLPLKKVKMKISRVQELIKAIKSLKIRGAPAIGIAGAYGVVLSALNHQNKSSTSIFLKAVKKDCQSISSARPTAVNLLWAVQKMLKVLHDLKDKKPSLICRTLEQKAKEIETEDIEIGLLLSSYASKIIFEGAGILTHCNAGGLATGGMGSALSLIYQAKKEKINFQVYVDETRPLLQGARLTTYELKNWKVSHTLICDNMAAALMLSKKINLVMTGADRIAMNGDTANKTGTYSIAVLARYHKIPFYIAAPYSTFDSFCRSGREIPIEKRDKKEITVFNSQQITPYKTSVYNPAFDVVPAHLISGIITEKGIIDKPNKTKIKKFIKQRL